MANDDATHNAKTDFLAHESRCDQCWASSRGAAKDSRGERLSMCQDGTRLWKRWTDLALAATAERIG